MVRKQFAKLTPGTQFQDDHGVSYIKFNPEDVRWAPRYYGGAGVLGEARIGPHKVKAGEMVYIKLDAWVLVHE